MSEYKQCGSYWDRGHTKKCMKPEGHSGLHGHSSPHRLIRWRLSWEETAIAKREAKASKVRP